MSGPFVASSYANYLVNNTLNEALRENMEELLPLDYTEEELKYGREIPGGRHSSAGFRALPVRH